MEEFNDKNYFRRLVENAPNPVLIFDTHWNKIVINLAAQKRFSLSSDEIIGTKIYELYDKNDCEKIKKAMKECKELGFSSCEATCLLGNYDRKQAVLNFAPIKNHDEKIISFLVIATDVSQFKYREKEMDFVFENSRAAMILIDKNGRWIKVNNALETDLGYPRDELLGKKTVEQKCTTEQTITELKKIWEYVIAQKKETPGTIDIPWKKKDGSILIHAAYETPYGEKGEGRFYSAIEVTKEREHDTNLKYTIGRFGSILSKASSGDLSAKININSTPEEYKPMGKDINKMIIAVKKHEKELEASKKYFEEFFNRSPVPLTLIGLDMIRIDVNMAMEDFTGKSKKELLGVSAESTYPKEERKKIKNMLSETIEGGYITNFETYLLLPDGNRVDIEIDTVLLRDKNGGPLSIIYTAHDITELKKKAADLETAISIFDPVLSSTASGDLTINVAIDTLPEQYRSIGKNINTMINSLKELVFFDQLTHLYSRSTFYRIIKTKNRNGALVMLDLDDFKHVNDTYGHDKGDKTLKTVAQIILKNTREGDIAARWGGDEFLIYLPRTSINDSVEIVERLILLLKNKKISASSGIAMGKYSEDLIKYADMAMYKAKKSGKGSLFIYDSQSFIKQI